MEIYFSLRVLRKFKHFLFDKQLLALNCAEFGGS